MSAERDRLRENLREAIGVIEGLSDQQAMTDPWFEEPLGRFRAVLQLADESAAVELDMAFDENVETMDGCVARLQVEYGVSIDVVAESGPGGGWPVVRLSGSRAAVERALRGAWTMDDDDLRDALS